MSSSAVADCLENIVAASHRTPSTDLIHDPDDVLREVARSLARELGRQAAHDHRDNDDDDEEDRPLRPVLD